MENNSTTAKEKEVMDRTVLALAIGIFEVEGTLETRGRDDLDFYEIAVWKMKQALEAAYAAGRASH